jgi:hypothetical protein
MSDFEVKEVIAKFRLTYVRTDDSKDKEHPIIYDLELTPVYGDTPENKEFFALTPWGRINLGTINEKASAFFLDSKDAVGKAEFYVIFRKAK